MEIAESEDAQDECGGDLEDAVFSGNRKLERIWDLISNGFDRLRLQRDPCKWYEFSCRKKAKALERPNGED
jgi:hypothetical protein